MAITGLLISILSFLLYFGFLGTVLKNWFLCLVLTLAALAGIGLTAVGYDKSYKISKNSIRTLKDRLKLLTSCFMSLLVVFFSYNIFFKPSSVSALIIALPYILVVMFIVWLSGFLFIKLKMKIAARKDSSLKG